MWVYSLQVSTSLWEVLQSFGLLGSRQWASDTSEKWLNGRVLASSRNPLVCRINICDNAQLVHGTSYQTSDKTKTSKWNTIICWSCFV